MSGQHIGQRVLHGACAGLLLGAAGLAWSPAVWGQGTSPAPSAQESHPRGLDRDLPGMRKGVLTQARNGTASIDRTIYTFAVDAVIQGRPGRGPGKSFQVSDLRWDGVEYPVDYWLATNADKQIIQMVIYFPQ